VAFSGTFFEKDEAESGLANISDDEKAPANVRRDRSERAGA